MHVCWPVRGQTRQVVPSGHLQASHMRLKIVASEIVASAAAGWGYGHPKHRLGLSGHDFRNGVLLQADWWNLSLIRGFGLA